jgi:phage regulator Rha-like protein
LLYTTDRQTNVEPEGFIAKINHSEPSTARPTTNGNNSTLYKKLSEGDINGQERKTSTYNQGESQSKIVFHGLQGERYSGFAYNEENNAHA